MIHWPRTEIPCEYMPIIGFDGEPLLWVDHIEINPIGDGATVYYGENEMQFKMMNEAFFYESARNDPVLMEDL